MIIDGNETERRAMDLFLAGENGEANRLQDEFVAVFHRALRARELDHCT